MFSWQDYPRYRISPPDPKTLRHDDLEKLLPKLQAICPQQVEITQLGESVEGRAISLLKLGHGDTSVFAWSQMHGNEPTHTAVLLDLVNFLQQEPEHPTAKTILEGCTLYFVVMLNPDGAERWTRRNAQDIDINRDALHLQTPEGQILHDAISKIQPDFALNLHNQRPRTTVAKTQKVASFSLLAPPVDAGETETENVLQAKRLAAYLAHVASEHSPGPISRYSADFMPRCFGEWVQQQGTATVTIEAGGWSTVDLEPLVQLHGYTLIRGLEALATGSFVEADPRSYDSLPLTGDQDLHDFLLRGVTILNGTKQESFTGDVGIGFENHVTAMRGAKIVDLGDLCETTGKTLIAGDKLVCLPGRLAFHEAVTPGSLPAGETVQLLLVHGVTTVLGTCDLTSDIELDQLQVLDEETALPIHVGFLARLPEWSEEIRNRLLRAIALGVLGVIADEVPNEVAQLAQWYGVSTWNEGELPYVTTKPLSLRQCAEENYQLAQRLGLSDRGSVRQGAIADLLVVANSDNVDWNNLQRVMVGGNVVFEHGRPTEKPSGMILKRRQ